NKFQQEVETEQVSVGLARQTDEGDYELITTEELSKLLDAKESMVLIDAMPHDESYVKEHIPGAVCFEFPIETMKDWDSKKTAGKTPDDYEAVLGEDKDKLVVVYCGFVKCGRS